MSDVVSIGHVFVPGKLPGYTYNPREGLRLEQRLRDYLDETGAILTVAGPTKTGKSVLLQNVVRDPAWVDGQGIDTVEALWRRLGDQLGVFVSREFRYGEGYSREDALEGKAGFDPVASLKGTTMDATQSDRATTYAVERPIESVVSEALRASNRPIVVDDFHFIPRKTQRDIVRALKPLVLFGLPVIFVSISHRVQDVVTAEPDMTGRVESLEVEFWSEADLRVIAAKGFAVLNVEDDGERIARVLANHSYGSPHLMQKFCREACKASDIRGTCPEPARLNEPESWEHFFRNQLDDASRDWFSRLLAGPKPKGGKRGSWQLKDGRVLDGYGLALQAICNTGPELSIPKDDIVEGVRSLVTSNPPAGHQTTRVLQHMTRIAAKRATEPLLTEEEMDSEAGSSDAVPDVQPVLEYVETPLPTLHIVDPFFAFYLRWGAPAHLGEASDQLKLWGQEGALPVEGQLIPAASVEGEADSGSQAAVPLVERAPWAAGEAGPLT